jgi:hypothetical protein
LSGHQIAPVVFTDGASTMTKSKKNLIASLEADIHTWENEASFFDTLVEHVSASGGNSKPGLDYARGLRQRIEGHKVLIEKLKNG